MNRHKQDYYTTPAKTVVEFLDKFIELTSFDFTSAHVLDPAAGGCKDNPMPYPAALFALGCTNVTTLDIRTDSKAALITDYMQHYPNQQYDLVITNPPYLLALDFIVTALEDCKEGGYVVMLLRLNFFGSQQRRSFFQQHMPMYCIVHSNRPRFFGAGEQTEYAHFVFKKGYHPTYTQTYVI